MKKCKPALLPRAQILDLAARCGVKASEVALLEFATLVREAEPVDELRPTLTTPEDDGAGRQVHPTPHAAPYQPTKETTPTMADQKALTPAMENQARFRASCEKRGLTPSQELFELWQDCRAAQPVAPSSQVAEGAELPKAKHQIDIYHADGRVTAVDGYTADEMRDAIAASRRAAGGDANKLASYPLEDFAEESAPEGKVLFGAANWKLTVGDVRAARASIATPAPVSAGQAAPAVVGESEWRVFKFGQSFKSGALFDVVLKNGVTEYGRTVQYIDWTQVADWRYSAAQPAEGAGQAGQVAGWAAKRKDGSGYGSWLHSSEGAAKTHLEHGMGHLYEVVALVERAAAPADQDGELWRALVRDTEAVPCKYPCLRDDLADWLATQQPGRFDRVTRQADGSFQHSYRGEPVPGPGPLCTYPKCNCPFDAPADPTWCARGLAKGPAA